MISPRLNRSIVLEQPERVADGSGGFSSSWTPLGTLWAQIMPGSAGRSSRGGMRVHQQRLTITVRGAPAGALDRPVPGQRFREGERVYLIEAVTEQDASGRFLLCAAREEIAS